MHEATGWRRQRMRHLRKHPLESYLKPENAYVRIIQKIEANTTVVEMQVQLEEFEPFNIALLFLDQEETRRRTSGGL